MLTEASASADQTPVALFNYGSTADQKVCDADSLSAQKCLQKQNDMLTSLFLRSSDHRET